MDDFIQVEAGTSNFTVNITSELRTEIIKMRVESDVFSTLRKRSMQIFCMYDRQRFKYMVIRWYNVRPRPNYWMRAFFIYCYIIFLGGNYVQQS